MTVKHKTSSQKRPGAVASSSLLSGVTLGSDPELMIAKTDTNEIVSAIPVLNCSKHNPINLGDGIKMYADNVLAETSFPPSKDKDSFIKLMRTVLTRMQERLGNKYKLIPQASYEYPAEHLKPGAGIDPTQIGCDPSFLAWDVRLKDANQFESGLRTGSCHFHFGHKKLQDFDTRISAIRLLDIFLGVSSVIFDKDETGPARRKYYGVASEHRPCDYGLEYRVMSPWILRSPELIELSLDLAEYALSFIAQDTANDVIALVNPDEVQTAINKCDRKLAAQILGKIKMPTNLLNRVNNDYGMPDLYKSWNI